MPIILDQSVQDALQATSLADVIKPTYFSDTLTGNGSGSRGLLNENMNPVNINGDLTTYLQLMSANKMTDKNGSVKTEHIPLEIIDRAETPSVTKRLNKDRENIVKIGTFTGKDTELYLSVRPVNIFHETIEKDDVKSKKTVVAYDILVWGVKKNLKSEIYNIKPNLHSLADGTVVIIKTVNLKKDLEKIADTLSVIPSLKFDVNALDRYLSDFNLYDEIVRQAKRWIYDVADEVDAVFSEIKNANYDNRKLRLILTRILKRLETYKVELNQYIKIQASLEKHFRKDIVDRVSKANLQILLANTLGKIEQQKHHIVCFTNDTNVQIDPKFSVEQREIITCEEPLIIAQATAGSGKSTTLNARVNHMLKCGVEAKDITVLSFSNAAADHIKELNEEIHSQTIASMVHEIYSLNYPNITLSNLDTIVNLIDIKIDTKNDDIANDFKFRLKNLSYGKQGAFADVNMFVEDNFDRVIDILNTIGQISLELEIIITYQNLMNMKEPDTVLCKHLIIDEVQDNSVFEFIFTLRYLEKHKCSLFIVGDASQTLFEFRASNPEALNMLEASGIFKALKLQTNYRSNPEILEFANALLSDIKANRFANLRLKANLLTKPTKDSFKKAVRLSSIVSSSTKAFNKDLPAIIASEATGYIKEKLAANEKIAFLAYSKKSISLVEEFLKTAFPDVERNSLIPTRIYANTIFTKFIKHKWNDIKFANGANIINDIENSIFNNIEFLADSRSDTAREMAKDNATKIITGWRADYTNIITTWISAYSSGRLTFTELLNLIKDSMIDFEKNYNNNRRQWCQQKNTERKELAKNSKAPFILSTIHSAKGLEFDNVVVIIDDDKTMSEEEKRMYYVALTRAMKSEFILGYSKNKKSNLSISYEAVLDSLPN